MRDGDPDAAALEPAGAGRPQLPEPVRDDSGRVAAAEHALGRGESGARPGLQLRRHHPERQRDPHRGGDLEQPLAAARGRLHSGARGDRDGQRRHRQLRRRSTACPAACRPTCGSRAAATSCTARPSAITTTSGSRRGRTSCRRAPTSRRPGRISSAARSAGRSSATRRSSSAATRAPTTSRSPRASARCRRRRCGAAISRRRRRRSTTRSPARPTAAAARRSPGNVIPREPARSDRPEAHRDAAGADQRPPRRQLLRHRALHVRPPQGRRQGERQPGAEADAVRPRRLDEPQLRQPADVRRPRRPAGQRGRRASRASAPATPSPCTGSASYLATPTFIIDTYTGGTIIKTSSLPYRIDENLGHRLPRPARHQRRRPLYGGWPQFAVTSYSPIGSAGGNGTPYVDDNWQYQFTTNATWTRGRHTIKFGGDIVRQALNRFETGSPLGHLQLRRRPHHHPRRRVGEPVQQLRGLPARPALDRVAQHHSVRGQLHAQPQLAVQHLREGSVAGVEQADRLASGSAGTTSRWASRTTRGLERYDFDTNQMLICGEGPVPTDCGYDMGKGNFSPRARRRLPRHRHAGDSRRLRRQLRSLSAGLRPRHPRQLSVVDQSVGDGAERAFSTPSRLADGIPAIVVPDVSGGDHPDSAERVGARRSIRRRSAATSSRGTSRCRRSSAGASPASSPTSPPGSATSTRSSIRTPARSPAPATPGGRCSSGSAGPPNRPV